jgi:hydrogenase expression/formation protein HypC
MCLAMPGRVIELREQSGEPVALVDFDGTTREVVVSFVPGVVPGDYVIVHAGVALQRLDEAAAAETLALLAQMGRAPRDEAIEEGDNG